MSIDISSIKKLLEERKLFDVVKYFLTIKKINKETFPISKVL